MDENLALLMKLREGHQQLLREWKAAMLAAGVFALLALAGWLRVAALSAG